MFSKICSLKAERTVMFHWIEIFKEDSSKNVTSSDRVSGHSGKVTAVVQKSIPEFSLGRIINNLK